MFLVILNAFAGVFNPIFYAPFVTSYGIIATLELYSNLFLSIGTLKLIGFKTSCIS